MKNLRNINRFLIGALLLARIIAIGDNNFMILTLLILIVFGGFQVLASLIIIPKIKLLEKELKIILILYYVFLLICGGTYLLTVNLNLLFLLSFILGVMLTVVVEIHTLTVKRTSLIDNQN